MDTITHGIAGALIGKALFRGDDLFAMRPMNRRRIVSWSMMLGAIFPDSDTFRDMLSHNELLMITWHRGVTHSLLCLPIFALLLATVTKWIARWRKWESPSFAALAGIYALGILSHILLDLVTSFGTMVWSPLNWSRPAWDLIFILDFTFTGILLVPQILAWVQERPEKSMGRALASLAIFMLAVFVVRAFGNFVGAPISTPAIFLLDAILATLFLLPLRRKNKSSRTDSERQMIVRRWNRGGLVCACAYLGLAVFAHHAALVRVKNFAAMEKLEVQALGALPFPPSLWRWDGLVRTRRGVYEVRMDLSEKSAFNISQTTAPLEGVPVAYRFYPEAYPNVYIEAAQELLEVQKVLWFDRFPVTRFHEESGEQVVEFSDMRFPQIGKRRTPSFTYRVRFGPGGNVLYQGWTK
ncbi:MAG: metal-dependent hydrolase [Acidobacteriota bacterium]|nr:metal-dependent hydrolase [Acidobacteriota bacterium]